MSREASIAPELTALVFLQRHKGKTTATFREVREAVLEVQAKPWWKRLWYEHQARQYLRRQLERRLGV